MWDVLSTDFCSLLDIFYIYGHPSAGARGFNRAGPPTDGFSRALWKHRDRRQSSRRTDTNEGWRNQHYLAWHFDSKQEKKKAQIKKKKLKERLNLCVSVCKWICERRQKVWVLDLPHYCPGLPQNVCVCVKEHVLLFLLSAAASQAQGDGVRVCVCVCVYTYLD